MSVLTGPEIETRVADGRIIIDPYDPRWVGPNSLDLHLTELKYYDGFPPEWVEPIHRRRRALLDPEALRPLLPVRLTEDGRWALYPGTVYLGVTRERIGSYGTTWMLGLRSSAGRLGLCSLAGIGDDGFEGRPTVELTVAQPLLLRPGIRLFQVTFFELIGERRPHVGRYQKANDIQASKLMEGE